jgi:protein-tyrosine phosphatase
MSRVEADEIVPGLWQGSYPKYGEHVAGAGFTLLVFCAGEIQPPAEDYPGVRILHAPNSDDYVSKIPRDRLQIAIEAAKTVAKEIQGGGKALVTCAAGINRSGLVSALTLHFLHGWPGTECIARVQKTRVSQRHHMTALDNPQFQAALRKLKAVAKAKPLPEGWVKSDSGLILPK